MTVWNGGRVAVIVAALTVTPAPGESRTIGLMEAVGTAEIGLHTIDIAPVVPGLPVSGAGTFAVTVAMGEAFYRAAPTGVLRDRTLPEQQAGVPLLVRDVLSVGGVPLAFDLTFVRPGSFPGQSCTGPWFFGQACTPTFPAPFTSPLTFVNTGGPDSAGGVSSTMWLVQEGVLRQPGTNEPAGIFFTVFLATFAGRTFQDVVATLSADGGTGTVTAPFTLTISASDNGDWTPIPEPALAPLTGLALWACLGRRCRITWKRSRRSSP